MIPDRLGGTDVVFFFLLLGEKEREREKQESNPSQIINNLSDTGQRI